MCAIIEKKIIKEVGIKIYANIAVSLSELQLIYPEINEAFALEHTEEFDEILFSIGVDTYKGYEIQENIQHRNRLGKVVICTRWVCIEREDKEWLTSGYASKEAIDRSKDNKLLNDIYLTKGFVAE